MAKLVKCPICGREFETARSNKKYCSIYCREAGRQLNCLRWLDDHHDEMAEYWRKYRKEKRKEKRENA